jgi:hypothetical protein
VRGGWPNLASIQTADGRRLSFPVQRDDAESTVAEALTSLEAYNHAANDDTPPSLLASPSSDTCRHCPYRGVCGPFFQALGPTWGWWPKSLLGTVTRSDGNAARGAFEVAISASNLDLVAGQEARLVGAPPSLTPPTGSEIAVIDASPTPSPRELTVSWSTQLLGP